MSSDISPRVRPEKVPERVIQTTVTRICHQATIVGPVSEIGGRVGNGHF